MIQTLVRALGLDSANGTAYLFWSGFGGDLTLVSGMIALVGSFYRHHNCHVHGCPRLGRHSVEGTPHVVCRRHAVGLSERVTHQHIIEAHRRAQERSVQG